MKMWRKVLRNFEVKRKIWEFLCTLKRKCLDSSILWIENPKLNLTTHFPFYDHNTGFLEARCIGLQYL